MSLLSWNCRGSGGSLRSCKMKHLARLMSSTHAQVTFISETRNSRITANELNNHFLISDSFVVPAVGFSGGLWVMWTDDVDVNIVSFSHFYVLACVVQKSSASSFNLVCVYGDPHHQQTNSIWNDVFSFVVQNQGRPTLCIGDLNNIMHANEKWGLGPPCLSRIDNFCTLVKQCGLMDLGYSGPAYTWTNKRFTTNPTFERLDRCLGDAEWCQTFPSTVIYHLPMLYSDHAPILAVLNPSCPRPRKRFKFQNWWLSEKDFQEVASHAWNQTTGKHFHQRSRYLASSLTKWVKKKKPLTQQLNDIENELSIIQQDPPHLIDHAKEEILIKQHNLITDKITDYYRQLSKKHWATKGDRNTKFFQHACSRRRQKNRILFIHNDSGQAVSSPQDIAHEFVQYFTNLFTSSIPMQSFNFNSEGTITNDYTNSTPSVDECLQIIKSMR